MPIAEERRKIMKKALSILLVLVICLSLCACGGGKDTPAAETPTEKTMDKNDTANYVGEWETEHFRLTITKGGVGRYENLMKPDEAKEIYDLNWEVKDEVLITQISFFGIENKAVLELNEDGTVLNVLQMGFPVYIEGETEFTKK